MISLGMGYLSIYNIYLKPINHYIYREYVGLETKA